MENTKNKQHAGTYSNSKSNPLTFLATALLLRSNPSTHAKSQLLAKPAQ